MKVEIIRDIQLAPKPGLRTLGVYAIAQVVDPGRSICAKGDILPVEISRHSMGPIPKVGEVITVKGLSDSLIYER